MMIVRGADHPISMKKNCCTIFDKHNFYNYNRSATLLDNGQQFHSSLEQILERAYNMVKKNSYIYQYEKYEIEKDNFLECFSQI